VEKVENAIRGRDNCRLNDLRMMTHFQHTGKNEELNSLHNKVFIEMMTNMYGRGGVLSLPLPVGIFQKPVSQIKSKSTLPVTFCYVQVPTVPTDTVPAPTFVAFFRRDENRGTYISIVFSCTLYFLSPALPYFSSTKFPPRFPLNLLLSDF